MISTDTLKQKIEELTKQRDQLIVNLQFVQGAIQFAQLLLDDAAKPTDESAKVDAS